MQAEFTLPRRTPNSSIYPVYTNLFPFKFLIAIWKLSLTPHLTLEIDRNIVGRLNSLIFSTNMTKMFIAEDNIVAWKATDNGIKARALFTG